ncbi:MAG: ABC transporter substrate binding protein [Gemmatimonadales bacterium]
MIPAKGRSGRLAAWRGATLACIAALATTPVRAAAQGAPPASQPAVLLLEPGDPMRPAYVSWSTALRQALIDSTGGSSSTVLYTETFDLTRFGGPNYLRALQRWLGTKYAGHRVDLLVVSGRSLMPLALELRAALWPGVPILITGLGREALQTIPSDENVTGLTVDVDPDSTLEVARALVPGLRRVALVGDAVTRGMTRGITFELEQRAKRGEFTLLDLRGLPMPQLRARVAELPDSTVVYDNSVVRDDAGVYWVPVDHIRSYAPASRVPIIASGEAAIGQGATGGWAASFEAMGHQVGTMARRVIAAGSADSVPPERFTGFRTVVDSRELERLGIPERRLPPSTEFRFHRASRLEAYWRWILGGALLLVLQTGLILAMLVNRRQRKHAQQELEENLRTGRLVAEMEAAFRDMKPEELDGHVERWLEHLAHTLGAERASLSLFAPGNDRLLVPFRWALPGVDPLPEALGQRDFPGTFELIQGGHVVAFSRTVDSSPPNTADRASFTRSHTRSLVLVPLFHETTPLGCLSFSTVTHERAWPLGLVAELQLAAGIFATAIGREREVKAILKEEAFTSAMIATAASRVAIVDRRGTLVRVSESWERPADTISSPFVAGAVGDDYPMLCCEVGGRHAADAGIIACGLDAVLYGAERRFAHEYAVPQGDGANWFAVTVERFDRYEGGAVVAHLDVTARRRAEHRAEEQRSQVEHIARVAAVSDLAASIAHELNQPLAAILTNAQAAARLVDRTPVPVADLREILDEIQDDDRRAAEIIGRIRGLLRKELQGVGTLDVNEVIRGVQRLLAATAARRAMKVRLQLSPEEMLVVGDRVQLEQVLINLMTNGFDAMAQSQTRELVIATQHGAGGVEVSVADTGTGIAARELPRMFEPFFTTKTEGLGLGLSIAQSIVEAGGGSIEAANRPGGGAIFTFYWPAAEVTA